MIDWCLTPTLAVFQLYLAFFSFELHNNYNKHTYWNRPCTLMYVCIPVTITHMEQTMHINVCIPVTITHMEQTMHINVCIPVTITHVEQTMHINVCIPVTITHAKKEQKNKYFIDLYK
jgi:flagellar motor switch protein FliM